ncbi:LysR family transcriptional regulator [Phaeobacter piscinae]|uniref:LysR family transcriptional regulator n=1 Tax=Phaeobacter piscinae TaxID=1580596 RepID=UPI0039F6CAB5
MKHDQLIALDAIVSTGTFRGAAERLHKSQSAISHTIRQLEDQLELELFSREAYRPVLTPAGKYFTVRPPECCVRCKGCAPPRPGCAPAKSRN